jgi:hypothetical protein
VKACAILLVALAGCGPDLCGYPELKTDTCITVHVSGTLSPMEKDFDALQVDVSYSVGGKRLSRRLTPTILKPMTTLPTLPVAFGVVYPPLGKPTASSTFIKVLATKAGRPVGYGSQQFFSETVKEGEHGNVSIELASTEAKSNTCFDGLEDGDETDVDCGGDKCPLCGSNKKCDLFSNADVDCASGVCINISGDSDRCQ